MIRSLIPRRLSLPASLGRRAPSWPAVVGRVLYVIGDIHGRSDCLSRAHDLIDDDRRSSSSLGPAREIYLGDFVDRGPNSSTVIDLLLARADVADVVFIRGNHEILMQEYLENTIPFATWRRLGGAETLMSYGIDNIEHLLGRNEGVVRLSIPEAHVHFLDSLGDYYVYENYCFVHAGLRPRIELERQSVPDLTRIRDEFLNFRGDFGYTVVHGHTPVASVDFRANRINIDTGAYLTSRLSVLKIDVNGPTLLGSV